LAIRCRTFTSTELALARWMMKLQEELKALKFGLFTDLNAAHTETRATRKGNLANINAIRHESQTQLEEIKAWTVHRVGTQCKRGEAIEAQRNCNMDIAWAPVGDRS
jgi:hypothetical protein